MKFRTIVADPPWLYDNAGVSGAAAKQYSLMSIADLCAMPVAEMVDGDAHLYMWATNPILVLGGPLAICAAWGFEPKTLLTWHKHSKRGMGLGFYFRGETEHVIFGVRGKLYLKRKDARNFFECQRGAHSAKPEQFYRLVESCSPGPYLELFARRARAGWTSFGNEVGRDLFSGDAATLAMTYPEGAGHECGEEER